MPLEALAAPKRELLDGSGAWLDRNGGECDGDRAGDGLLATAPARGMKASAAGTRAGRSWPLLLLAKLLLPLLPGKGRAATRPPNPASTASFAAAAARPELLLLLPFAGVRRIALPFRRRLLLLLCPLG